MSHFGRSSTQQPLHGSQAQSQPASQHQYQAYPEYLNQAPPQPEYLQAAAHPSELASQPAYLQPQQHLFEPGPEYRSMDWTQPIPQQDWSHDQQYQYQQDSLPVALPAPPPPSQTTIDPAVLQQTPHQPYVPPATSMLPPGPIHKPRYWPLDMLTRPFVPAEVVEEDDEEETEEGEEEGEEEDNEETDFEALRRLEEQTGDQAEAGATY